MSQKKTYPLVSVIMNSHNGAKFLKKSVKSVLNQSYKNWEIIFWDNFSKDESKQIIQNFKEKRIRYFYSKNFNNLYKSRNLAIKKAKGKYICFLDVDDIWKKNKILKQVRIMEKYSYDFIYSNFFISNKMNGKLYKKKEGKCPEGIITQELLNNYLLGILTVMIRRKIFDKFKFKDKYNIIGDFELFIRLSTKYNFYCIQEPLATYYVHGNNYSSMNLKTYFYEMKEWLKENNKILGKNFNLKNIKFYIFKLRLKYFLNLFFNRGPLAQK